MDKPVFFSEDMPSATASRIVARGEARRLAPGVYTPDVTTPPEVLVARNWLTIAGHEFPDATVTDRSAPRSGPVDGVLYLAHPKRDRDLTLPGLRIAARQGAGPQPGDIAMPGGLHLASKARGMAENAMPSRARRNTVPRRLSRHELGEWIDQTMRFDGPDQLNETRDLARGLAAGLGVNADHVAALDDLIGTALGTREARDLPPVLHARRYLRPYDPERTARFDTLVDALRQAQPQSRAAPEPGENLPFFEAYFSNFIEGTEFTVEEASSVVFDSTVPENRSADAHDIIGTFGVVNDDAEMSRRAANAEEFMDLLRSRHATVMAGRPDRRPGQFKQAANQAGATTFVEPSLVEGTVTEGFARLNDLDTAWERSVYSMFLVAEVHPFDDGNGRLARIVMNAELVAGDQHRIIIPTVFRDDYLASLRRLSRQDDPSVLIKALRFAQDWTARIDFTDFDTARRQMTETNAFEPPADNVRLLLPSPTMFGEPAEIDLSLAEPNQQGGFVQPYRRGDGTPVRGYPKRRRR